MTRNRSFVRAARVLPAALALHVAEEAPSFAAWARRNAWSGYTQRDFMRINAAGLATTVVGTWLVARTCRRGPFLAWHTAVLSQQTLWNPVFHAATTVAYREYSPGLVTALALFPATWVALTAAAVREERISPRAVALSALAGAAVHATAVAQQVYGLGAGDDGVPRRRTAIARRRRRGRDPADDAKLAPGATPPPVVEARRSVAAPVARYAA